MTDHNNDIPSETTSLPVAPDGDLIEKANIVTALLKAPQTISDSIQAQKGLPRSAAVLLATALACHAVFGLAVGMFGGLTVALMDIVKVPLVAVCSLFLCFPSL